MRIIRDFDTCPKDCQGTVLALGNFDGVHRGHQAILKHCVDFAHTEGTKAAAMTFEPHPREFFAREKAPLRLCSLKRKLELLEAQGIEVVFLARFNRRFASVSAHSFIHDILHTNLRVKHVITGYNFAFGKGRGGDTALLADEAQALGFGFTAISPVEDEQGQVISSSAIREALAAGDTQTASRLLGHPYRISGRVRRGEQRGRQLGFPTLNLSLQKRFRPRFGVYAAKVAFHDESRWHPAVANLGVKPTFSSSQPLLEAHCFDMKRDAYGEYAQVELLDYLREEIRFNDIEALKCQIADDCQRARLLLEPRITG